MYKKFYKAWYDLKHDLSKYYSELDVKEIEQSIILKSVLDYMENVEQKIYK